MARRATIAGLTFLLCCATTFALEPNEILIIANSDIDSSIDIAEYYCSKRNIPKENILALALGTSLSDKISRADYDKKLAEPIRDKLLSPAFSGRIRCLLTVFGLPYRVGQRDAMTGQQQRLQKLRERLEQEQKDLEQIEQATGSDNNQPVEEQQMQIKQTISRLQADIDRINGKETGASVDSELSMVLFGPYELYRWQSNRLKKSYWQLDINTLMVCRLDGPSAQIAKSLIDKSIAAEQTGLKGFAYIDSRGIADDNKPRSFGYFDQSLRDLAVLTKFRTQLSVKEERSAELFEPNSCPQTALYCGWYSLKNYIDAFDFADGAVGYHIASLEAVNLRDPNSRQWCPAMLDDGITATLGAVAEPYLHSFPQPKDFFLELFEGKCLVEAYYRTKPFNSWQLVLIGDPLYTPFKKPSSQD